MLPFLRLSLTGCVGAGERVFRGCKEKVGGGVSSSEFTCCQQRVREGEYRRGSEQHGELVVVFEYPRGCVKKGRHVATAAGTGTGAQH